MTAVDSSPVSPSSLSGVSLAEAPEQAAVGLRCLHCLVPRQRKAFWALLVLVSVVSAALHRYNLSQNVFASPGPYYSINHPLVEHHTVDERSPGWDLNGPPVRLEEGETILTRLRDATFGNPSAEDDVLNHARRDNDKSDLASSLPVVQFRDNQIPGLTALGTPIEAAEALVCKESVINYVINATDVKDECEGLTKAFEKTCSRAKGQRRRRVQSRTLREKIRQSYRWQTWAYETSMIWKGRIKYWVSGPQSSLSFFAEDAVAGDAYEDARFVVENDLDEDVYRDLRVVLEQKEERRRLQENADVNKTKPASLTRPLSLEMPKAGSRLSGDTLDIIHSGNQGDAPIPNVSSTDRAPEEYIIPDVDSDSKRKKKVDDDPYDPNSPEARICCVSILNVYQENCSTEPEEDVSDSRLFFVVSVMAICGLVKSLIRHFRILWLPEAGGCILVGVLAGYCLMFFPHHDISFDGNWFLRILVPPIIFEAALGIDKRSFNRHIVPILLYAIVGTLVATFLTAFIVHRGTAMLSGLCPTIPFVEALTFGALISSIDPIAVLSVLNNMGMTDTDTIYVVIFGESLLNDGVAIVLFHTLVHFLDETLVIDPEAVTDATVHFFVVAFGSLLVGVAGGIFSTVYYWLFYKCQTPMVEVIMFFCWALFPYYICDGIGWSGIVAAVATGFVMDLHIVGQKRLDPLMVSDSEQSEVIDAVMTGDGRRGRRPIFSPDGHLSEEAKHHIGFVAELMATAMEMAIFAYLGFFLFSHRYHWNVWHTLIAILACGLSRAIMIPALSLFANWITRIQQLRASCQRARIPGALKADTPQVGVVIDRKMQIALWFAGLRGAMSFALVEHIPLYDAETGEGTRLKPELKAMTSASIMFTVFVLGGMTYYMMEHLGVTPTNNMQRKQSLPAQEMSGLLARSRIPVGTANGVSPTSDTLLSGNKNAFRRTRLTKS